MPRSTTSILACLAALAAGGVAAPAAADAPLRTDNADVPDAGNCKVETWYEGTSSTRDFVVAPACVPFGVVEWGATYDRSHESGVGNANVFALQAKVPILPRAEGRPYAVATTFWIGRDTSAPHGDFAFQAGWLNVPASVYLLDDRLRLHGNVGTIWRYATANVFSWGVAGEYDIDRITWLAETYHLETARPRFNLGARYAVLGPEFTVYASGGRRFGSDPAGWLFTVGLKLESPTFLK